MTVSTAEQSTVEGSLGCSLCNRSRSTDTSTISRLFTTQSIQITRQSHDLSAVRDAIDPDQPTLQLSLDCSLSNRSRSTDIAAISRVFTPQYAEALDKKPPRKSRWPFMHVFHYSTVFSSMISIFVRINSPICPPSFISSNMSFTASRQSALSFATAMADLFGVLETS